MFICGCQLVSVTVCVMVFPWKFHRIQQVETNCGNMIKYFIIFSAKQMWCLGLYLPLVVADLVPDEDEHLELLSTLLQILRIVFSPTINKDQLPYLQVLIQTHHEKFQQLFPQCSIIPKMHYMVHMPRTILQ